MATPRQDFERIRAYIVSEINAVARSIRGWPSGGHGGGTSGPIDQHELGGPFHSGNLPWNRVAKTGASIADIPSRNHSLLNGLSADDHAQYVHTANPRTITARHTFNPGSVASPFIIGANASGRLVEGLNAQRVGGQLESVFMRKVANSDLNMVGYRIFSDDADTTHTFGRADIGHTGHGSFAGFRHRALSGGGTYALIQNASGRTVLNAATGQPLQLRINNSDRAALYATGFELYSPTWLKTDNYASQLTGWRITYDGQGDFRYLFTDELHAKLFIADLEQALAGGQIICKSVSLLSRNFTAPAAGGTATLYVRDLPSAEDMAVFQSGDIVRIRTFSRSGGSLTIADCWGVVTSYSNLADKEQSWTFTRSSGGNAGAMSAGTVVQADSIVLDYGTSGNGFHEVNAIDGLYGANSPYSQIATWSGHPATGQTIRTRMGNLAGVGFTGEYGLYARGADANQYLKLSGAGALLRNIDLHMHNGSARTVQIDSADGAVRLGSDVASDLTMALRSWSDGRIRIGPTGTDAANLYWSGTSLQLRQNTTPVIRLDSDGSSYFAGIMTIGASGEIRQGSGTVGSNYTGLRIWRDSGIGRIAGYNNNILQWYAATDGKLYAGGGNVQLHADGIDLQQDSTVSPDAGRAISWWSSIASQGGNPTQNIAAFVNGIFQNLLLLEARAQSGSHTARAMLLATTNGGTTYQFGIDSTGTIITDATATGLISNSPSLGSGWSNRGGGEQDFTVRRFGSLVEIVGLIDAGSSPATTIATLPTAFRPSARRFGATPVFISSGAQNLVRRIDINTNGTVQAAGWTPASGDSIQFCIMYYM